MADAPGEAELRGVARSALGRREQRRDRREVVRVGRVAEAEEHRDARAPARASRRWRGAPACRRDRTCQLTFGRARAVIADAGDDDDERAHGREQADHAALELEPAEGALREDGDEADAGDREREPGAEGDDQQQAERHPVQRDRGQEDDERGGAREQAARDRRLRSATRQLISVGRVVVTVDAW